MEFLQANPEVEVSVSSPEYAWIRLAGKAVFENNMAVKEGCMNNPIVKGQYQTADNPIFEVFYLEDPPWCDRRFFRQSSV